MSPPPKEGNAPGRDTVPPRPSNRFLWIGLRTELIRDDAEAVLTGGKDSALLPSPEFK
jgi:hypothetical protein